MSLLAQLLNEIEELGGGRDAGPSEGLIASVSQRPSRPVAQDECCNMAARMPMVHEELNSLDREVLRVNELTTALTQRLQGVMRNVPEAKREPKLRPTPPVPMASAVNNLTASLQNASDDLADILDRLEV